MVYDHEREETFLRQEKRTKEIAIEIDTQNREIASFLEELGVTTQQIETFLSDANHFSLQNWEKIQELQKQHEEKSASAISQIVRPKKKRSKSPFGSGWIAVP